MAKYIVKSATGEKLGEYEGSYLESHGDSVRIFESRVAGGQIEEVLVAVIHLPEGASIEEDVQSFLLQKR